MCGRFVGEIYKFPIKHMLKWFIVMSMKNKLNVSSVMALVILIVFILDTILHFVIVPLEELTISWISLKGDIDFIHIGVINILVRVLIYGSLAFIPKKVGRWLPLSLLTYLLPTLYLMVDSWWVFENYVLLYGYWFALVLISIVFSIFFYQKHLLKIHSKIPLLVSLGLGFMILIVYIDIMGLNWPYEFVYAFIQRIIYEPFFLFVVYRSAILIKGE